MAFAMAGYELVHHGEGRWNGVAIAARNGMSAIGDVVTNFGDGPVRDSGPGGAGVASARTTSTRSTRRGWSRRPSDGIRIVSLYAPNGRVVGLAVLRRQARLVSSGSLRWLRESCDARRRRSSSAATSTSPRPTTTSGMPSAVARRHPRLASPSAARSGRSSTWGLVDAYRLQHDEPGRFTWWDYRAGMFHKNFGMRIDHLLVTPAVAARVVDAEIDREARKGPPVPSDHAPLVDRPRRARASRSTRTGTARSSGSPARTKALTEELPCRGAALAQDRVARDPTGDAVGGPDLEEAFVRVEDLDLVAAVEPAELA